MVYPRFKLPCLSALMINSSPWPHLGETPAHLSTRTNN